MFDATQLQPGCVLDGARGWRITADLITDIAKPLGFPVSDQDLYVIGAYNHNLPAMEEDGKRAIDPMEYVIDLADRAEEWLNEQTPSGLLWHWHDGEFFLSREDHEDDDDLTDVSVGYPEQSIEGFAVFIEHTRMGPTVRVGPFESDKAAFAWIDVRSPNEVWSIVALQDPADPATPDWN